MLQMGLLNRSRILKLDPEAAEVLLPGSMECSRMTRQIHGCFHNPTALLQKRIDLTNFMVFWLFFEP